MKEFFKKGFTLIELLVVLAIIGILSWVILTGITRYIERSKDSNIEGTLGSLILSGEIYYNNYNSYDGFCQTDIIKKASFQMPKNPLAECYNQENNPGGICCGVDSNGDKWAACAFTFGKKDKAFCVDSRGIKKEINKNTCVEGINLCP